MTSPKALKEQLARARRVCKRYALLPLRGVQGWSFGTSLPEPPGILDVPVAINPLEAYFDANVKGPGIWKWRHYFDIYHAHFARFVGTPVTVVEIGIYSGGSLKMWKSYFGEQSEIVGVDIEESCLAYREDSIRVLIGDQADPSFWARFRKEVPNIDIVIDDGGHEPHQQIATLEALLPHLRPGGVFLCEDVIGRFNPFHHYACGLARALNSSGSTSPNPIQSSVKSVSFYPFVTVVERRGQPLQELIAPKHGSEWQPFMGSKLVSVDEVAK